MYTYFYMNTSHLGFFGFWASLAWINLKTVRDRFERTDAPFTMNRSKTKANAEVPWPDVVPGLPKVPNAGTPRAVPCQDPTVKHFATKHFAVKPFAANMLSSTFCRQHCAVKHVVLPSDILREQRQRWAMPGLGRAGPRFPMPCCAINLRVHRSVPCHDIPVVLRKGLAVVF